MEDGRIKWEVIITSFFTCDDDDNECLLFFFLSKSKPIACGARCVVLIRESIVSISLLIFYYSCYNILISDYNLLATLLFECQLFVVFLKSLLVVKLTSCLELRPRSSFGHQLDKSHSSCASLHKRR